jgi:two-component system, chemotaxis family, chemotaxis protein CheY
MKFLVVDDSGFTRRIIMKSLWDLGFKEVSQAEDGSDALAVLNKENIDVVITDWFMPNMDGITLVKRIKSEPKFAHIKIIMVTTWGEKERVVEALANRVNGFIVKPFTSEVLQEQLEKIIPNQS